MFSLKKILPTKKVAIILVGSEKVKVAICEKKDKELKILAVNGKRQEKNDFIQGEIVNIEGVCTTIEGALDKSLKIAPVSLKEIVINIPTSSVIGEINKINYQRKEIENPIDIEELDNIVGKIEHFSIAKAQKNIYEKTGYKDLDLKLVSSSITQINIDNQNVTNPIGFAGKNICISVMNIFTPISKFSVTKSIGKYLGKNIDYCIPKEFALGKILEKSSYETENVTILDIGYSRSRIIIQKGGTFLGFKIIDIGINDLIKSIQKDTNEKEVEIYENLGTERYFAQKREFLSVWGLGLIFTIKEIMGENYLPEKFLIVGENFDFIQEFLKSSKFSANVKVGKEIKFINEDFKKQLDKTLKNLNIGFEDESILNKIDLGLLSLIIAYSEIINLKDDVVIETLKNVIDKIKL